MSDIIASAHDYKKDGMDDDNEKETEDAGFGQHSTVVYLVRAYSLMVCCIGFQFWTMIPSFKLITGNRTRSPTREPLDDPPFDSSSFDTIFRTTHPEKARLGRLASEGRLAALYMNAFIVPQKFRGQM
jgi:hypothetical protein